MWIRICLPAVLLVVPFATAAAQEDGLPPQPGERVRLKACSPVCEKLKGTCAALSGDTLRLRTEDAAEPAAIPIASVMELEVQRGRKSNWATGAIVGFGLGAAAGAIAGAAVCADEACSGISAGHAAFVAGAVGGAGFAIIGTVLGALTKSDKWEEVPLDQLRVSVVPGHDGVGLRVSVGF